MSDYTLLSAMRICRISRQIETLLGYSAQSAIPIEIYDNSATDGGSVKLWEAYLRRTAASPSAFYDFYVNCAGTGAIRITYNDALAHTINVSNGNGQRLRGSFTPPAASGLIHVKVFLDADAGGSLQAWLYWLDEYAEPTGYTAMNDATALQSGESADVPGDLDLVEANLSALENLRQLRTNVGFRASEHDLPYNGAESATRICRLKIPGKGGYLYYMLGVSTLKYEANSALLIKFYVNTTTLVGQLLISESVGEGEFGSDLPRWYAGALSLAGISPVPDPQVVIRVHVEMKRVRYQNEIIDESEAGEIACRVQLVRLDWVGRPNEGIGSLPRPDVGDTVGDLRALWDATAILAGDDGTGYGQDGRDAGAGYPVGYAVVDGRSPVFHVALGPDGRPWHLLAQHGEHWQIVSLRRTDAPYLYLKGKHLEIYRLKVEGNEAEEQILFHVEDTSEEGEQYAMNDFDVRTGEIYFVRCNINEEDAQINYAAEGW